MKFTCDKNILCNELAIASEVISSKSIQASASYIQLNLIGNKLSIKGTDTHNGFSSVISVEDSLSGVCIIHCDRLLEVLKRFPDGDVHVEMRDEYLHMQNGTIKAKLNVHEVEAFPVLYEAPEDSYIAVPQEFLLQAITHASISVAVDSDKSRLMMNGILLDPREDGVYFVGTDGRRLSLVKGEFNSFSGSRSIIAHARFYAIMKKFLLTGEGEVYISIQTKHLFFKQGNSIIYTTFIDGQFPNYMAVIPNNPFVCTIKRKDLHDALKRVQVMSKEDSYSKIFIELGSHTMKLYSHNSGEEAIEETLACEYAGEPLTCAVNSDYLMNPIRVSNEKEILLSFKSPSSAILISGVEEKSYKHIIMPMKI